MLTIAYMRFSKLDGRAGQAATPAGAGGPEQGHEQVLGDLGNLQLAHK